MRSKIKNTITMLRLAGKLKAEDELHDYTDMGDTGDGLDLAFADRLKDADRELREGKKDEAAVSSALDGMQEKMMALEVCINPEPNLNLNPGPGTEGL